MNQLSVFWFKKTSGIVENHFESTPNDTTIEVKKAKRIDIEWIARDYLYGSSLGDYNDGRREFGGEVLPNGLRKAEKLPKTILTPTTKADTGHDLPLIKEEAVRLGLVTEDEWEECMENTFELYKFYNKVAEEQGLIIPDFKIEFGRYNGRIIQIDEAPNHDSARIWIARYHTVGTGQENWCLDKEFYRQFLIDSGIDRKNPPHPLPEIPPVVVEEIRKRCLGAYDVFTGRKSLDSLNLRSLEEVEEELGMKKR